MNGMVTCSVEDLYESIETRGGLTARMKLEQFVSDMRATAGTVAQPVVIESDDGPDTEPFAKTMPSGARS